MGSRFIARLAIAAAAAIPCTTQQVAAEQLRVVTYNVFQLQGDRNDSLTGLFEVLLASVNDDKPGFAVAPHVFVFQEVTGDENGDVATLFEMLLYAAPGATYALGMYTNDDGTGNLEDGGAQAMFYRSDTLIEITDEHVDIPTGAGRQSDRWKLRIIGRSTPDAELYIYSSHLKAGDDPEEVAERTMGAELIRADADSLPAGTQIIFAGDYNFQNAQEEGYAAFLAPGVNQAFDPLGTEDWSCAESPCGGDPDDCDESKWIKYTQSTHCVQENGFIGSGMDDRFDFQLVTASLMDDEGIFLLDGEHSYRALGNDGLHFNVEITEPTNFYYPDDLPRGRALASDLFDASDHLPVIVEYVMPSPLVCSGDADKDGTTGVLDLLEVIVGWGPCDSQPMVLCAADLTGDGFVTVEDLVDVILNWGNCQ